MIYTGDIKDALAFLKSAVDATPDFDRVNATDKATLTLAANRLTLRLKEATEALDGETQAGGLGGPELALSGDFAPGTAKALLDAIANSDLQSRLIAMSGFAGRVAINLGESG